MDEIEWDYDSEGYFVCPDCFESMSESGKYEVTNHSSDCEIMRKYLLRLSTEGK